MSDWTVPAPHRDCEGWHEVALSESGVLRERVDELIAERDWLRSVIASLVAANQSRDDER